jgi:hypothetical protein
MKDVGKFFHIHISLPFYGHLVNFSRFGKLKREKSGNPGLNLPILYSTESIFNDYVVPRPIALDFRSGRHSRDLARARNRDSNRVHGKAENSET